MILGGVPPGSNVYNLTTWPEAIVFLAIMAVVMFALYLVYLAARPFLEARAKCWKCPEEGINIMDNDTVQRIQGSDAATVPKDWIPGGVPRSDETSEGP